MKYPFIEKERKEHTVRTLCRVLSVAASGYYAWRRKEGRLREYDNIRLLTKIKVIHERSEETHSQPEDLPQRSSKSQPIPITRCR